MYTSSNSLRKVSIDDAKAGIVIAINEIDNTNKKSYIKIVHDGLGIAFNYPNIVLDVNQELEQNCTNNTNYKLTGFPVVKTYFYNFHGYINFDLVWQQVVCNGADFCTIQAISKRYRRVFGATGFTPFNNNQFIYLSSNLTKNSFFPSVNYKDAFQNGNTIRRVCYSFDDMNKITSANGLVGYKNTNGHTYSTGIGTIDDILKTNNNATEETTMDKPKDKELIVNAEIIVFPNPASNDVKIQTKGTIKKVEFFNANGTLVKAKIGNMSNVVKIIISDLPNGQYIVKVHNQNGEVQIKKVIIIH